MGLFGSGNKIDVDLLRSTPLFAGFSDAELKRVAKLATRRDVAVGETVIEQGRFGDACFVISEGVAAVYINDVFATTVSAPTAVGEMALLERRPRNASVVAESPMVLAEFGVEAFRKLLADFPTTEGQVKELLNARLHENRRKDAAE